MDLRVSPNAHPSVFTTVTSALQSCLGGTWEDRANGLDQRYWDLRVDGDLLTVHLEHLLGIFLCFQPGCSRALVERAAAAIPVQEEWTVRIDLADLFCPGSSPDSKLPLTRLRQAHNHIHGALHVRLGDRLLPRLGFWGPNDVCVGDWLVELHSAIRQLDASPEATFVFDEGEQGQPLFKFRRSAAQLFLSVEDSILSDGPGDPDWKDVPCDYEDFRMQVFRLSGELRSILEGEIGVDTANSWLQEITGRITQV